MDGLSFSAVGLLKTAAAGLSFGGGIHLVRRSAVLQRSSIRRRLREHAESFRNHAKGRKEDWQHFPRSAIVQRVCGMLRSPPVAPLVLTGPQGAGTSAIAEAALARSEPPLLLLLNLRERAATADRTLFWHLVRSSGYYVMFREWADVGLFRANSFDIDAYVGAAPTLAQLPLCAASPSTAHRIHSCPGCPCT